MNKLNRYWLKKQIAIIECDDIPGSRGLSDDEKLTLETFKLALSVIKAQHSKPMIPKRVYQLIYEQCDGFVFCSANPTEIWNVCHTESIAAVIRGGKNE